MSEQLGMFEHGVVDAAPMPEMPSFRVEYVAGVLAQTVWGNEKRSKAQRKAAVEVAREAINKLRGAGMEDLTSDERPEEISEDVGLAGADVDVPDEIEERLRRDDDAGEEL